MTPTTTATFAATLLVLAVVGWSVGWIAAGKEADQGLGDPSPSAPVTWSPTSSEPSPTPSPASATQSPTPEPTRSNAFDMPDLRGEEFVDARKVAWDRDLGVNLRFDAEGFGRAGTVMGTNPEPGVLVWPGLTVTIYVKGPAPELDVPDALGRPCYEAKTLMLEAGLQIASYPSGQEGTVYRTDPEAAAEARWNDRVTLYCSTSAPEGGTSG